MIAFIKRYKWFVGGIMIVAILVGIVFLTRGGDQQFDYIIVKKRYLVQEISVTGRVRPAESVDLAFEKSGRIAAVLTDVSKKVFVNQLLVQLENRDLQAQLTQANATLKQEQAILDELRRGTRGEELDIQRAKVDDAKSALVEILRDSFTKADDAIRNKIDQFINSPRTTFPDITLDYDDTVLEDTENIAEDDRIAIEQFFNTWKTRVDTLTITSDLLTESIKVREDLTAIKQFLDVIALLVNDAQAVKSGVSQITLDGYRADVATARSNINTALTNVTSKKSNLTIQEQELNLKLAGTTFETLQVQEAKVEHAQANIENIKALLAKTIIRSPISGVVTKLDAKVGEIASANISIISIISAGELEIKVNIPEADIAKLSLGDIAQVTLDAYSYDIIFETRVTHIDPAETIIEGVATYSTTLQFNETDDRIRSGMTANIDILTGKKENVIAVPQRAILIIDDEKFVRILTKERDITEVAVTTGLRGSDGTIEITSGLKEEDQVITFIR